MQKVLVADASEQWRELLERTLSQEYLTQTCADGLQALELVACFEPDVFIMDLMLTQTDGLSVLKALEGCEMRPKIIVTGRYFSDFITSSLEHYAVDHVVLKPCGVQSIRERVQEMLESEREALPKGQEPYDYVTALLVSLGAPTSQQGFRFLRSGILMLMKDPSQQLTKELYPAIARAHNTSAANVEKALRTTVGTAWLGRREEVWRNYFPQSPTGHIPRPTAGQFMIRLTDAALGTTRQQA